MTRAELAENLRAAGAAYDRAVIERDAALEKHRTERTVETTLDLAIAIDRMRVAYSNRSRAARALREANIERE